ncbi:MULTISPECIES: glycosyltransferase family 4 protein [unclassified Agrobacterium]|uniref:glycosyltransferase family 4 protein n=1 Tax=unclassified Agrobacterium TaxID=2632611 RepID=UPI00083D2480|nr:MULTISPECIES: glycosyltransferase family 1 protein [unclassified Agrobacterium]AOG12770.1 glycosyl transferases group 1 family protein [Agrobacterium sp. RAC06]QGG93524.1 glycosyltransferase [Agrobacterium sp. MA01]
MTGLLYFDLTEALLSTSGKRTQYYGIARTVHEIGREAALLSEDIRFVVFSFGTQEFYEVNWQKREDGSPEFDLPKDVGQKWVRSYFGKNPILPIIFRLLNLMTPKKNRDNWLKHAGHLKPVAIEHGTFFSAARPKLIVDMVRVLRERGSKAAIVPLLHDFMPLHDGATKRFRKLDRNFLADNRFLIERASQILTNSNFTAKELQSFVEKGILPKPRGPVSVVQLVHHCPDGTEPPEVSIPTEPYILTVALNLGRKNIEVVLEALRQLHANGKPVPQLVIAGSHRKRLRRYASRPAFRDIQEKLIFIDNPNQTDLVKLYKGALALVMPSKLEGWGLPAGEALWCGTPAICSTAEALQEVCEDLAIYFQPDDASRLAQIIEKLAADITFNHELRKRINEARPTLRTWNTVARETLYSIQALR